MFTGIIESTGTIKSSRSASGGRVLEVQVGAIAKECALGASVCISGVCLTVSQSTDTTLSFDVIRETLDHSTLGDKRVGDKVNIERSLRVGDRLDGHFVQGHVDGIAVVDRVVSSSREHVIWLRGDSALRPCIIPKGSVALDGVSLTIAQKKGNLFSVALIPTTLDMTTFLKLASGHRVNVETDILVRTIVHTLSPEDGSEGLQWQGLREAGMT